MKNSGLTPALNVIVTCTKRKTSVVPRAFQLRHTPGTDLETKAANWTARLNDEPAVAVRASNLYAGDQWQIAKSLPEVGAGRKLRIQLWVASAGYGLVSADASLKPYSATFSAVHPDSIRNLRREPKAALLQRWWAALAEWAGPAKEKPRTLAQLTKRYPEEPLLVVASSTYLLAMSDDLALARSCLSNSDLLTIISAGTQDLGTLTANLLPCDARLRMTLGGSLMSLNVRIARRVISKANGAPICCSKLSRTFEKLLKSQPELPQFCRQSLTDTQLESFILKQLSGDGDMRASPMLRNLRDQGFACEQKRFNALHRRIVASKNA